MFSSSIKLIYKKQVIPQVYLMTFQAESVFPFKPGQFVSLETWSKVFRAYSILDFSTTPFAKDTPLDKTKEGAGFLTLAISTKPGGLASQFFDQIKEGDSVKMLNISGRFGLTKATPEARFFVATGTGIAPFVPMIKESLVKNPSINHKLFFGTLRREFDFCRSFFTEELSKYSNFEIITCIDEESFTESKTQRMGRVTTIIPDYIISKDIEFYLCGNPHMVLAMEQKLKELGFDRKNIIKESFGSVRG